VKTSEQPPEEPNCVSACKTRPYCQPGPEYLQDNEM
jgi:hypothetical protein